MDNSLINVGELAKPADTLIQKIADAIGVLYEPKRIIRKAKAEAKAKEILALSDISIDDIKRRAANRFIHEEITKQENIESIIEKALPDIKSDAETENVSNDWLFKFFDEAKMISDSEMQALWSKLLANESNRPGTYSKRTIGIISELEKSDALSFQNLLQFSFMFGGIQIAMFDTNDEIYKENGITFSLLTHLDNLGLLQFNNAMSFRFENLNKHGLVNFYNRMLILEFQNDGGNSLDFGHVFMTNVGQQIASLCNKTTSVKIQDYIISKWKEKGIKISV